MMSADRRPYIIAVLFCLAMPLLAQAQFGYLVAVGPAPLRFVAFVPPPTTNSTAALPQITVELPRDEAEKLSAIVVPPPAEPVVMEAASDTNQVQSFTPPNPDDVVSPQMLLRYFNKSTNGPKTSVIAPMEFTPPPGPPAAPAPSSKASYSTSP